MKKKERKLTDREYITALVDSNITLNKEITLLKLRVEGLEKQNSELKDQILETMIKNSP